MCKSTAYHNNFPAFMGCCSEGHHRQIMSREETIARLEKYKKELTSEIKAVDEIIKEEQQKK